MPNLDELLPLLAEAFTAAWERTVDRDRLASLILEAHLHARQVQLVRAACQYLRQAGLGASPSYVRGILSVHREFVRHWVEVFEQRFAPDGPLSVESRLATYVDAATTRDEFRVLDWYAALLGAVVRTNYFRARRFRQPAGHDCFEVRSGKAAGPRRPGGEGGDLRVPPRCRRSACEIRARGPGWAALVGPGGGLPR